MDLTFLSNRLSSLSLTPTTTSNDSESTKVQSYFFTPKSGSKHPSEGKTEVDLKLVIITLEDSRNVGAAKTVANSVGLKDMRAIGAGDLLTLLGRSREEASLLSLPSTLASQTLLVTSSSLASLNSISLPSPIEPSTESLTLSSQNWSDIIKTLEAEGAAVKDYEFALKGEEVAAPVKAPKPVKAAPAPKIVAEAVVGGAQMGMTYKKQQDGFGEWYQQALIKGEMLDYYDISGCYILKPWSYSIWQEIQNWFDKGIKDLGVENCYFPMFVSAKALEKEKDHIEGFAPEVAWVTRAGQSDLEEPIAIRPTSETVMYPAYAKWIRSHRDLPLRLNQWNSVVRWEFKNPQPFIRTREFLWQEGHTAFFTQAQADEEVLQILDLYRRVYEELLAVPVIPGVKSEKEKFAGGLYTTTIEGFIPTTGRGIQAATSHSLGQNFSNLFNIKVEDPTNKGELLPVWQNSWGLSTRSIGVMVMVHGDDKGLVIPPRVAQIQVVIVPTGLNATTSDEERERIFDECVKLEKELKKAGIRVKADVREHHTPAFKWNEWELKGVPLRLDLGGKDLAKESCVTVRRDTGLKASIPLLDITSTIQSLLITIQAEMLAKAKKSQDEHVVIVTEWKDFVKTLNGNNICVIPWCENTECEEDIKKRSAMESQAGVEDEKAPSAGAKSLCIPHDQTPYPELDHNCPGCGKVAKRWTLFGRSY